jgi:uncharacterized circularly permuted ATP-grasp superfamily protein
MSAVESSVQALQEHEPGAARSKRSSRRRVAGKTSRSFGSANGEQVFRIDPIPRVIEASEWEELADGVAQRVRALELFVKESTEIGRS